MHPGSGGDSQGGARSAECSRAGGGGSLRSAEVCAHGVIKERAEWKPWERGLPAASSAGAGGRQEGLAPAPVWLFGLQNAQHAGVSASEAPQLFSEMHLI